jgi:hypothetical protein
MAIPAPSPEPAIRAATPQPCLACAAGSQCDPIMQGLGAWISRGERRIRARMDELKRLADERDKRNGKGNSRS